MADLSETIAIVLAAGAGKRMGVPKALMRVDIQPWWLLQHRRLQAIGVPARWVVSEAVEAEMNADAKAPNGRVLADSGSPMMASVLAGVRSLSGTPPTGVFVLPIDTPAPNRKVWEDCCSSDMNASPVYEDRPGHPVYLAWSWVAKSLIDSNPDPMTARLDELIGKSLCRVHTNDHDTTTNINQPEDLDQWLRRGRSDT